MKKSTLILLSCLSLTVSAQDLSGLKIFLNPGHGGYNGANDRNVVIAPFLQGDTLGFWESKSNLDKAFYLRSMLQRSGAEVLMSRTLNREEDDLPLSQISEMANASNADFFFSLHSNAHNSLTNYTLMLFPGEDNAPRYQDAKDLSTILWDNIYSNQVTTWTYHNRNVRGDLSFYGYHLGVLKNLMVKGMLCEGSFHDYIPETYRLMSPEYKKLEAWHYFKTVTEHFKKGTIQNGAIAGDVRDTNQELVVKYNIIPNSRDKKLPIDRAKITLLPDNKVYETDTLSNGFFMFDDLKPGTYQLKIEKEGYHPTETSLTVEAHKVTYSKVDLMMIRNTQPQIVSFSPDVPSSDKVDCSSNIVLDFNWDMDQQSVKDAFSITPAVKGNIVFENNSHRMRFIVDGVFDTNTLYTVRLNKSARHPDNMTMDKDFEFKFMTKDRNKLALINGYPYVGDKDVSTSPYFMYIFDKTLSGNLKDQIRVYDAQGVEQVKNVRSEYYTNKIEQPFGSFSFKLSKELLPDTEYYIEMDSAIVDDVNIPYGKKERFAFRTIADNLNYGQLIQDFEADNLIAFNESKSVGTSAPIVARTSAKKLFGSYAYQLKVNLDQENASAHFDLNQPCGSLTAANYLGMHIYGDGRGNELYGEFGSGADIRQVKLADLDFSGWKYVEVPLTELATGSTYALKSLQIKKSNSPVAQFSELYFDNLHVTEQAITSVPDVWKGIVSVYPNPVSDVLTINGLDDENITVRIYSMNGQCVKETSEKQVVVNDLPAGTYILNITVKGERIALPVIIR